MQARDCLESPSGAATAVRRPERLSPVQRLGARPGFAAPLLIFLVTRSLMLVMAWAAPHLLPSARTDVRLLPRTDPLAAIWGWSSPWFRFDTGWYVGLAEHGYHWGSLGHANTNFFPLYPLLIRLTQPLTLNSPWIAAFIISNAAFLWALVALWRWSLLRWSRPVACRMVVLVAVFPFTLFFVTPYAEPVFLAAAATAFLLAEQDRWELAAVAAGLSVMSRPVGIAVVLALLALALKRRRLQPIVLAYASGLPLLAFILYLDVAFGHPFALLTYHSAGWVRPHGGLLHTVASQFHTHLSPFDRIDAATAVIFLFSGVAAWRRIGRPYGIYTLVGLLLPLVHGLVSMERYVIVLFPAMAVWASWESKAAHTIAFAASFVIMIMATIMFASGYSIY